jgi:hypothetical protein
MNIQQVIYEVLIWVINLNCLFIHYPFINHILYPIGNDLVTILKNTLHLNVKLFQDKTNDIQWRIAA